MVEVEGGGDPLGYHGDREGRSADPRRLPAGCDPTRRASLPRPLTTPPVDLSPRRQRILRRIVEEYVATAQPVASELIQRKYEDDVSSATVRNEMAALEELGLIAQPYTSAGRVPTDRGYRVYVERLMDDDVLPAAEQRTIRGELDRAGSPAESARLASMVLARTLRSAAVATPPAASHSHLLRVELVPLHDDMVLVTAILDSGSVRQVAQTLERAISPDELARLSNEVSARLRGKALAHARAEAGALGTTARTFADVALRLLQQAEEQSFAGVYYEGLAQLLSQPEFAQSQRLKPILEVLEQRPLLARFLAESLATPGVQVFIGAENPLEQMREASASVVLTRYGAVDDAWGVLGVVGPTRLPYWRAVPAVRFMAGLLEMAAQSPRGPARSLPAANETPLDP